MLSNVLLSNCTVVKLLVRCPARPYLWCPSLQAVLVECQSALAAQINVLGTTCPLFRKHKSDMRSRCLQQHLGLPKRFSGLTSSLEVGTPPCATAIEASSIQDHGGLKMSNQALKAYNAQRRPALQLHCYETSGKMSSASSSLVPHSARWPACINQCAGQNMSSVQRTQARYAFWVLAATPWVLERILCLDKFFRNSQTCLLYSIKAPWIEHLVA